jgi:hypothetical protein
LRPPGRFRCVLGGFRLGGGKPRPYSRVKRQKY